MVILEAESRVFPFVYVQPGTRGTAANLENGSITADTGVAGLYGRNVNQDGYIRSVTAVTNNGRIELHASENVTTGVNSITESKITDNPESVHSSFGLTGGEIHVAGLDEKIVVQDQFQNQMTNTRRIVHAGAMTAKSGTVTLSAQERVYLESDSRIDVSGYWVRNSTAAVTVEAQLNSVELKNDHTQKDGILQGMTVVINPKEGSSIGDLSATLNSEYLTAREMATAGGEIRLSAPDGDIIVRKDALLDFSGGGTIVSSGHYNTTKLVSGTRVYDISDAPESIQYDSIATCQEKFYERYGIVESYEGLYFGGAVPILEYNSGYIEGDDAGRLILEAKGIVLDGVLNGSAIAGIYQTETSIPEEMFGNFAVQTAIGIKTPRGGELIIGAENPVPVGTQDDDLITDEVVISASAPTLPDNFGPDDDLKTVTVNGEMPYVSDYTDSGGSLYRSIIDAEKLNNAGLSDLSVCANSKITVQADAEVALQPGGLRIDKSVEYVTGMPLKYLDIAPASFELEARAIEHSGIINIPNGNVFITLLDTVSSTMSNNPKSRQVEMNSRAFLAGASSISVAGEKIDNSLAGDIVSVKRGYIDGGSIKVWDTTKFGAEVILAQGAILDVSSGYELDADSIEAGSAGNIRLKGSTLVVEADLRGYSLQDTSGGSVSLHANTVAVQCKGIGLPEDFGFDAPLPAELKGRLIFVEDQLADTGFTHITLKSFQDLTFAEGVTLLPSLIKMAVPNTAVDHGVVSPVKNLNMIELISNSVAGKDGEFLTVPLQYLGTSSITAKAGQPVTQSQSVDKNLDTYTVCVSAGSLLEVAPGGSIELSGLITDIAGTLIAPAGTINLSATGVSRDLTLQTGSYIRASGVNLPVTDSAVAGLPLSYETLDGGSVTLTAKTGNIIMESGSVIDVSGSTPVESLFYDSNNNVIVKTDASDAGNLALSYFGDLTLEGELIGSSYLSFAHGASLSIAKKDQNQGLILEQANIEIYSQNGFDALAFSSLKSLIFSGDIKAELSRSLVLDAPLIIGSGDQKIEFKAPSITFANTRSKYGDDSEEISYFGLVSDMQAMEVGDASLTLTGKYIDVTGGIALSGFGSTTLDAAGDIRLTDEVYYDNTNSLIWKGQLRTPGDLTLRATRVYPTTLSDFTLTADGRITILPGNKTIDTPIVSAGGSLTLAAAEIDHQGYLTAPMGSIRFIKDTQTEAPAERILFGSNSITTIASDSRVNYGTLEGIYWTFDEKPTELTSKSGIQPATVEGVPKRRVHISGEEVIIKAGAMIDSSGGGSIFAFEFLPGTDGLMDPFLIPGTSVVVPGIRYPGTAVYLTGGGGLSAGTYSLLSEEYAFMKGAYVIEYLGSANKPGSTVYSKEGYTVVTGYDAVAGSDFISLSPGLYSVRPASEVFYQGDFNIQEIIAGSGGTVDIKGTTTIMDGIVRGDALDGYKGGVFAISGAQSAVVRSAISLDPNFSFDDSIAEEYNNTAQIIDTALSDRGLSELSIGTLGITETVTIEKDAVLETPVITLSADSVIRLEQNSVIIASDPGGAVTFNTPQGAFAMEKNAAVNVSEKVNIIAQTAQLDGEITSDGGTLSITSNRMVIVPDAYSENTSSAMYLTESLKGFEGFGTLEFQADSGLMFLGDTTLAVSEALTIDTPGISGEAFDGLLHTELSTRVIRIVNTGTTAQDQNFADAGDFIVMAEEITIGHGNILFDGFDRVNLTAVNDVALSGEGALYSSGDLNISAASVTTTYYQDDSTDYEVARFLIQAGNLQDGYRDISIKPGTGTAGDMGIAGGTLDILGNTVDLSGSIAIAGGWVSLEATGASIDGNGVILSDSAMIDVSGTDYAPGGRVTLQAAEGSIHLDYGTRIDVSAGRQGDAGKLTLYAPQAGVSVNGIMDGRAGGGQGGTFVMDTGLLNGLSSLLTALSDGGFDEKIDFRVRTGNIELDASHTMRAHHVKLTADIGHINLAGTIDASEKDGGVVEIAAGNNLTLLSGGVINASATANSGSGGSVFLNAAENQLTLAGGSVIDVSAGQTGSGGTIHLRAGRTKTNDDVKMNLSGTIRAVSQLTVEGVRYYEDTNISSTGISTYQTDVDAFLANTTTIESRLLSTLTMESWTDKNLHITPGIEVRSSDDLTLASNWDLTSLGISDQAGFITLRAAGNLVFNQSLVDHPSDLTQLNDQLTVLPDSWGFNLIAGADQTSADTMATVVGTGDLTIAATQVVYTENSSIRFASGRDIIIQGAPGVWNNKYMVNYAMEYNIATYSGGIQGDVGRDLNIHGSGAIQSAIGNIQIAVKRDLYIDLDQNSGSAIRTTGTAPPNLNIGGMDWNYAQVHNGGSIVLDVGRDIRVDEIPFYRAPSAQYQPTPHLLYWDNMHLSPSDELVWSADYGESIAVNSTPTAGVAAMGDGSVTVTAGGDVSGQIGTFKQGNLSVFANGNMAGYYQVVDGMGVITAMGNITSAQPNVYATSLALFDAQAAVTACGNIDFGTVLNPTFLNTYAEYTSINPPDRYLDYGPESSVTLIAVTGDLFLSGGFWKEKNLTGAEANAQRVLPPIVNLSAGGAIQFGSASGGEFVLAPAETGNLNVHAGGAISGLYADIQGNLLRATLRISDLDPEDIYRLADFENDPVNDLFADETKETTHAVIPLHSEDDTPVSITAGGNIQELQVITPKQTTIEAGGDITGLYFFGQNLNPGEVTTIQANGDIGLSSVTIPPLKDTGLRNAGPGLFLVQAAGSIDLGITQGIQTVGNAFYSSLSEENSALAVIAGLYRETNTAEMATFFDELREYGIKYSQLQVDGDLAGAAQIVKQADEDLIDPFFARGEQGKGDINMTGSSIQTTAEASDIFIISNGNINVGLTNIPDPVELESDGAQAAESGIFTARGGEINIFSMGDLNVNESRVMTFRGGDITVWSDQGNINAGRGSKTAVNAGSPRVVSVYDNEGNLIAKKIVWEPPSVGSGIRTLTYDPDGFQGPLEEPPAGDAFLFAPQGVIDAGEAGISASNVILGATEVLNAENISFSLGSVGVPSGSEGADLGALSGAAAAMGETSKMTEESVAMKSAQERMEEYTKTLSDTLVPKWISVEVIGFDESEEVRKEE